MTDQMDDNIFEDLPEDGEPLEEPESMNFVTVRSAAGVSVVVPDITDPLPVSEVIARANLQLHPDTALFVDGTPVSRDFTIGPGGTITLLTLQKAG